MLQFVPPAAAATARPAVEVDMGGVAAADLVRDGVQHLAVDDRQLKSSIAPSSSYQKTPPKKLHPTKCSRNS